MAHSRPDNCLLLRDGSSYLLLDNAVNSALILRDIQGLGGGGVSAGYFSRGRWRKLKEEEEKEREKARKKEEGEERRKQAAQEKKEAEAKAAKVAKRIAEDVEAAISQGQQAVANAQEANAGTQNIAEAMWRAGLTEAAMRNAAEDEALRQAQIQDENDIAEIVELERQEIMRHLNKTLSALFRHVK
jgi:hypothetical protein